MKAFDRGSREGFREVYGDGFKSTTKVHKSSKDYNRKDGKYKLNPNNIPDDVD